MDTNNITTQEEIFCKENFFTDDEVDFLLDKVSRIGPGRDYRNHEGPFANQLLTNYLSLIEHNDIMSWLHNKLVNTLPLPSKIISATRILLYLPWDIHNDYHKKECDPGHVPYYNFLIPLGDFQSRTIVFDQYSTEFNNFSDYKNTHSTVANPPSQEFWQENLSMCWPQDREYVTVKSALPYQHRGQLIGFPSKYFHSSDNFHTRFSEPKVFLQIRTQTPA